jgi:glycosyltransferase involved in cell wall biosynthesis
MADGSPQMGAPRVSVVIPCHNYGRFLREAVDSVMTQTRVPDEVVVIDDGSTDDTPVVLAELCAEHAVIQALSRSPARGVAATRNDAIAMTTGDLVVNLDADDRLSPTYLEVLEGAFADPAVGFAYTPVRLFGAVSRCTRHPWSEREEMRENIVSASAMFRRSLHEAAGGFSVRFERLGLEDWEFWVKCVRQGAAGRLVDGAHLEYRQHQRASRNRIRFRSQLRVHVMVWWLHRPTVRFSDVVVWLGRALRYQFRKRLRRRPDRLE